MASKPVKKKSKGSAALMSHKVTTIYVPDTANDELDLIANLEVVSAPS